MSIKDFRTKNEILITVKGPGEDVPDKAGRKAPIPPSVLDPRHLPRRTQDVDNTIYLSIYDVGTFGDGTDIDFVHDPTPGLTLTLGNDGFGPANTYKLTVNSNFAADWNSWLFATDPADFPNNFGELIDLNPYAVSVNEASTWTPGHGFQVAGHGGIIAVGGTAIRAFNTSDTAKYKITGSRSFGAAEIPFVLDASAEVYLMPTLPQWIGVGKVQQTPGFYSPLYDYLFGGFRKPLPRSQFLSNPTLESLFGSPIFGNPYVQSLTTPPAVVAQTYRDAFRTIAVADAAACMRKVDAYISFSQYWYTSDSSAAASGFPTVLTPNVFNYSGPTTAPRPYIQFLESTPPAGLCVAAIKKGSDWFYVWPKADFTALSMGVLYRLFV